MSGDEDSRFLTEANAKRFVVVLLSVVCAYVYNEYEAIRIKVAELALFQQTTEPTRFTKDDASKLADHFRAEFKAVREELRREVSINNAKIASVDKKADRNQDAIEDIPKKIPPAWFERLVYRLQKQQDKAFEMLQDLSNAVSVLKGKSKK